MTVHALADELLEVQSTLDPLNATMLGVPGFDGRLADPSPDAEQALRARAADILRRAAALDRSALNEQDALTAAVIDQQAEAVLDRIDARMVEYTVTDNNYVGPAAALLTLMPSASLGTREQTDDYLERLRGIPAYLEQVADRHRTGAEVGRVPVRRLVDAAMAHLDRHLADREGDPLLRPPAAPADAAFEAERGRLVADFVRPALARYRGVLGTLATSARPDDRPGLCWLPDGEAAYAALSRVHTTTRRTPGELHAIGLEVIAGLREEYAQLGERVFGTADQEEIFRRLATDPAMRWTDGEELLAHARATITRAEAEMANWFGVLPGRPLKVRPVPASEAPGAPFAYYHQPPLDGSRPGIYFASTYQADQRDRFISEVTAFHEGIPGHHLQLSIAIEQTQLPLLRQLADINATIEGWALYSERLADEMGLYSDDIAKLGMLAMDSKRAARLVVDTGIHAMGWTRDQAIDYVRQNTPAGALETSEEINRYIGYPAQALSYMIGRLEIQRFRAEATHRLGSAFDIRSFHDLLLTSGPLPLDVLDGLVSAWPGRAATGR